MTEKGTKVIIYNLWEDDQGQVELDFDTDCFVSSIRTYPQYTFENCYCCSGTSKIMHFVENESRTLFGCFQSMDRSDGIGE
jgi:hypothetical protein